MSALPPRAVRLYAALVLCGTTSTEVSAEPHSVRVRPFIPLQTARVLAARPKECARASARGDASPWQRVRERDVEARCARLARGLTRVLTEPQAVLQELREAHSNNPSGATRSPGPLDELTLGERALEARAWLRSGDTATAFARFSGLQTLAPITDWHVFAVHDFAVAAVRSGKFDVASACYRRLVGVAPWLPWAMKVNVLIEASAALLHASPEQTTEVLGYLSQLDAEMVGAELRQVIGALRAAARGEIEAEPMVNTWEVGAGVRRTSLRLADEDLRFVEIFVATKRGDDSPGNESREGDGISLPAFQRVLQQLRARP